MAEQIVSDLLMKFELSKGNPIEGESSTELDLKSSDMTRGFIQGKVFEVNSFTFKTQLDPEDEEAKAAKAAKKQRNDTVKAAEESGHAGIAKAFKKRLSAYDNAASGFDKWRAGGEVGLPAGAGKIVPYSVDMEPFKFTRAIDKASSVLWKNCINRITFDNATLIKRKAAGGKAAGEVFLRMDFEKVLIIGIDWDQDEPIKETCTFVSRAVTIHYAPQLPDGTLGAPLDAFWTMNKQKYHRFSLTSG